LNACGPLTLRFGKRAGPARAARQPERETYLTHAREVDDVSGSIHGLIVAVALLPSARRRVVPAGGVVLDDEAIDARTGAHETRRKRRRRNDRQKAWTPQLTLCVRHDARGIERRGEALPFERAGHRQGDLGRLMRHERVE